MHRHGERTNNCALWRRIASIKIAATCWSGMGGVRGWGYCWRWGWDWQTGSVLVARFRSATDHSVRQPLRQLPHSPLHQPSPNPLALPLPTSLPFALKNVWSQLYFDVHTHTPTHNTVFIYEFHFNPFKICVMVRFSCRCCCCC